MINTILFDMDGLLVDTEPVMCKSVIDSLKLQGIELSSEDFYKYWTRKGKLIAGFAREKGIDVDVAKYRDDRDIFCSKLIETSNLLMPNAYEAVENLSSEYKLALVSGSPRWTIDRILQNTKLEKFFPIIVGWDDVTSAKPDPEGFLLAAKALEVEAKNCVVIEDAQKGVAAASAANMKAIAIPNRYTKGNDFSEADLILKDISELTSQKINAL